MKKFLIPIIVFSAIQLSVVTIAQSTSFKYSPYGIEIKIAQSSFRLNQNGENPTPDEWEQIGPNGFSGYCIAVDPQDENIIYVGGLSGLYKTIDGGVIWNLVSSSTINHRILDIAINAVYPNIVLSWFRSNFNNEMKLMRSTDSGETWSEVLNGSGFIGGSIIFDPQNNQRVYAHINNDSLYLSTNGGINWETISSFGFVDAFAISPQASNILYAVSNLYLHKSTNGGESWELINPQLPASFTTLKISQTNSEIIFAGNEYFNGEGGFYRSTDGGNYWSHLTNGFGISKSVSSIAIDQGNPNILYAGGWATGIYRSDNLGDQWTNISETINDNYILALNTTTTSNIYSVLGGSIYRSTNQGSSWQSLNGNLQNCDVFQVVSHPTNPDIVYTNSVGGVYRSYDGGMNWQLNNDGLFDTDVFGLTIDPTNPNILYAGTFGGLVYKSTDSGDTWVEKSNGLSGFGQTPIWKLTCHPNEPSWIWTGNYFRVYQSTDSGENWTELFIAGEQVGNMYYAPGNHDIMYAFSAVSGSKLYRSTNRGGNWEIRNNFQSINELAIDSYNSDILYASSFNMGELVKSNDGGLSWEAIDTTSTVRKISVNPINPNYVYAATFGEGVQRSTDSGMTWHSYNNGLENISCFSLQSATGQPHKLFVATFGNSIYQVEETVSSIEDPELSLVSDFKLRQNYPNPFNPSTKISWQVPVGSYQTLKIFDVLGNEVASLVDEYKTAGAYEVEWNAERLPSGVYFYQLKAGSYVETKKMVLMK